MSVKSRTPEFEFSLARQTAALAAYDWAHSRVLIKAAKIDARCRVSSLVVDMVTCAVDDVDPQHLSPYAVY